MSVEFWHAPEPNGLGPNCSPWKSEQLGPGQFGSGLMYIFYCTYPNPASKGHTETLQLTFIPHVLAWYIQYQHIYSTDFYSPSVGRIYPIQIYIILKIYIPQTCAQRAHRNLITYIHPLSVGMIYPIPIYTTGMYSSMKLEHKYKFHKLYICIGYILPTIRKKYMPVRGFLQTLWAQGWEMYISK